jgi:hypothetical protein
LYAYRLLIQDKTQSYPSWMRTRAWRRRELQTMLGSWTDGRIKEMGQIGSPPASEQVDAVPPWGYVEPQPQVYGHLAATIQMLIDDLERGLMLPVDEKNLLAEWQTWLVLFQDVARRELTGQTMTNLEYQRLTDYATDIVQLTETALDDLEPGDDWPEYAIAGVTQLASSQESLLLEAVGWVDEIYVVVQRGQQRFLTRGGVYSHYEFEWPIQTPLGNALWIEMLVQDQVPPRPEWMAEFVVAQEGDVQE